MTKAPEIEVSGAAVRRVLESEEIYCQFFEDSCPRIAAWRVTQETCDAQDDPFWYACDLHLADVATDAIDFEEEDDD